MKVIRLALVVAALVGLSAVTAAAQLQPVQRRSPHPAAAALAAAGNILFMPVRFAITTVGAELGGLTGFLTAGNQAAAADVWRLTDGQVYLSPNMVQGREPVQFGDLEFRMHLVKPKD